jgi:hypothetical protein
VRFLGFTDKVAEAYAAGDISLMTSISEAFPYGVVESLMCGRPIVSTEVGGVREALGEFGMTAPSRDVDGLARAVVTMLRRPADELAQLSRGARQRAVDNFTLDRFIGEYRESYLRLAALGDTRRQAPALPDPPAEPLPPAPSRAETEEIPVPAQHEPAREPAGELTASELTAALRDPDPFVRTGAIARAGRGPGVAEALIGALADPYPQVRREAIRSLARIDGSQAAHALIETATGDPSPEVREEAVAALGPLLGDAETDAGAGA